MSESTTMERTSTGWTVDSQALEASVGRVHADYPETSGVMRTITELHARVRELIEAEEGDAKILAAARGRVHSEEVAAELIDNVRREIEHNRTSPRDRQRLAGLLDSALFRRAKQQAIGGVLWAVFGSAVTAITYAMADPGGIFIIMWGAIVFGIIDVFKGLFGMASHSASGHYGG